jgi:glutamate transport system substrate-binding protein
MQVQNARARARARHRLISATLVLAFLPALAGCAGASSASTEPEPIPNGYGLTKAAQLPPSVQRIKDRGTLTVGIKFDQPGFGLQRPGRNGVDGFDAEIARLIAIRIFGTPKVTFVKAVAADREKLIQEKTVDVVVATYTITPARAKLVAFVGPYFVAGQDLLVRTEDRSIDDLADLRDKQVCTQQGSTSLTRAKRAAPAAIISTAASYKECADGVRAGKYDAVSTDDVILAGLAAQSRGTLRVVGARFSAEPYGIGVQHDDTDLQRFIGAALGETYLNGDWSRAWLRTLSNFLGSAPEPPEIKYP